MSNASEIAVKEGKIAARLATLDEMLAEIKRATDLNDLEKRIQALQDAARVRAQGD